LVAKQLGNLGTRRKRRVAAVAATSTTIADVENRLREYLSTQVTIHHGADRGRIEIEYYGEDDLQRILSALGLPASET
jgi:hypothetical protein